MNPWTRTYLQAFFAFFLAGVFPVYLVAKTFIPQASQTEAPHEKKQHRNHQELPNTDEKKKEWNVLVYIAGNNNLYRFVEPNLKQMESVGSNEQINIICQVEQFGTHEMKRYEIHKNKRKTVWRAGQDSFEERKKNPLKYTSGTKQSLESFLSWAINKYPAKRQFVVLWNHGSGIIDPYSFSRLITNLHHTFFTTDPMTGKMVTDGSDDTDDLLNSPKRGIAFNDKHPGYFLTNQDLSAVFKNVRHNNKHFSADQPGGALKKIDVIGMDACCMANIEIATQLREHTNYIIFSQEVVLGAGWNYATTLKRLGDQTKPSLSPLGLCKEVLTWYAREYEHVMPDYTLSVVDLVSCPINQAKSAFILLEEKLPHLRGFLSLFFAVLLAKVYETKSKAFAAQVPSQLGFTIITILTCNTS